MNFSLLLNSACGNFDCLWDTTYLHTLFQQVLSKNCTSAGKKGRDASVRLRSLCSGRKFLIWIRTVGAR